MHAPAGAVFDFAALCAASLGMTRWVQPATHFRVIARSEATWQSPGRMLVAERYSKYGTLLADASILSAMVALRLYREIATGLTALAMTEGVFYPVAPI